MKEEMRKAIESITYTEGWWVNGGHFTKQVWYKGMNIGYEGFVTKNFLLPMTTYVNYLIRTRGMENKFRELGYKVIGSECVFDDGSEMYEVIVDCGTKANEDEVILTLYEIEYGHL